MTRNTLLYGLPLAGADTILRQLEKRAINGSYVLGVQGLVAGTETDYLRSRHAGLVSGKSDDLAGLVGNVHGLETQEVAYALRLCTGVLAHSGAAGTRNTTDEQKQRIRQRIIADIRGNRGLYDAVANLRGVMGPLVLEYLRTNRNPRREAFQHDTNWMLFFSELAEAYVGASSLEKGRLVDHLANIRGGGAQGLVMVMGRWRDASIGKSVVELYMGAQRDDRVAAVAVDQSRIAHVESVLRPLGGDTVVLIPHA